MFDRDRIYGSRHSLTFIVGVVLFIIAAASEGLPASYIFQAVTSLTLLAIIAGYLYEIKERNR